MKSAIVYYSKTGTTKKVAETLTEHLKTRGEVATIELVALDENDNFFRQGNRAFKRVRAQIKEVNLDLSGYDLICFGTPVWAFSPAPAMNACLDQCSGVADKQIALFTTSGGAGDERCMNYMQNLLMLKGAQNVKTFSFNRNKVKDKEFVLSKIKAILP